MKDFDFIADVMPWFMSAITLYMTHLQGRKNLRAWMWGLANQLLWLAFILHGHHWGLVPLNAGLWYLYLRNLLLWVEEEEMVWLDGPGAYATRHELQEQDPHLVTTDELKR